MEPTLFDRLRPFISKVIAAPIAIALVALADKTGVTELGGAETQAAVVGGLVWLLGEVIHTFISKKTNPANTASARLAARGAAERERMG